MLQDLLLALYGIPGAIFVQSSENRKNVGVESSEIKLVPVSDNLPFVPPGEFALYRELLELGSCYATLEQFIKRYTGPFESLYLSALARGFDMALNDYRGTLVHLESELLADQDLNITHFSCRLHSYRLILPTLRSLAKKIDVLVKSHTEPLGCKLLDLIIAAAPSGLPGPRHAMRKLLAQLLRIFCRQLHSWLILGTLHDPHNEFFIQTNSRVSSSVVDAAERSQIDDTKGDAFTLVVDRIPEFLSTTVAHQVLFTGQSIDFIIRSCPQSSLPMDLEELFGPKFYEIMKAFSDESISGLDIDEATFRTSIFFDLDPIRTVVSEVRTFVSSRIWQSLVKENDLMGFLRSVKDVALLGRGELFLAFVDQSNSLALPDQLDQSLSLRVETHNFTSCRGLLDQPLSGSDVRALEYDVNAAFLTAARSLGLDDEVLDLQFRFVISPSSDNGLENDTIWDRLRLQLNVPPALQMAFSKQVCRGYERLFRFLALVRRTQLALQNYWAERTLLGRRAHRSHFLKITDGKWHEQAGDQFLKASHANSVNNDRRLIIRNYMAFFVENLQYYLQVDVIESQFSYLMERIQSEKEADLVLAAHEAFVASLQAQCLLFHPTAKSFILRLLSLCQQFVSAFASNQDDSQTHLELEEKLFHEFRRQSSAFFNCLNSSESVGAKSGVGLEVGTRRFDSTACPRADLNQLLLRLDFNNFFNKFRNTDELQSNFHA